MTSKTEKYVFLIAMAILTIIVLTILFVGIPHAYKASKECESKGGIFIKGGYCVRSDSLIK